MAVISICVALETLVSCCLPVSLFIPPPPLRAFNVTTNGWSARLEWRAYIVGCKCFNRPETVTHHSSNWTWHTVTLLIKTKALSLSNPVIFSDTHTKNQLSHVKCCTENLHTTLFCAFSLHRALSRIRVTPAWPWRAATCSAVSPDYTLTNHRITWETDQIPFQDQTHYPEQVRRKSIPDLISTTCTIAVASCLFMYLRHGGILTAVPISDLF